MARSPEKGNTITRRNFLRYGSGFVLGSASGPLLMTCSGSSASEAGKGTPEKTPDCWKDLDPEFDLLEHLHMADVSHHGLFIEMGSPARHKFTMGDWMCGWDMQTETNGVSFCYATHSPGRIFFHLDHASPLHMIFKIRPEGNRKISVYLNEQPLRRLDLKSDDWEEYAIQVDASKSRKGENYLKFVYSKSSKKIHGQRVGFAIESIRICEGSDKTVTGADFSPPRQALLRQTVKIKESELDALVLPAPAMASYYLELEPDAKLGFSLGSNSGAKTDLTARVTVTDAGSGRELEVVSTRIEGDRGWNDKVVSLEKFSVRLVRIDFEAQGKGRAVFGRPAVLRDKPRISSSDGREAKNLVILLIDTLRADHVGAMGAKRVKTPALDRFAKQSVKCSRCQAPANWTKPSCATVLTGLYPDTHLTRGDKSRLSKSFRLISEMVKEKGFSTAAFIANGYLASEFGFNRGWDKYVNYIREERRTEAEHVFKETAEWIESVKDKRFLAYIQTIDPHVPYDPPKKDLALYDAEPYEGVIRPRSTGQLLEEYKKKRVSFNPRDRKRLHALYNGEVTYHDRYLDRFIRKLADLDLLDDTLIAVCADHGEEFFEHGSVGHGHTLFQELLHVPMFFRHPEFAPAGSELSQVMSLVDIVPTMLDAAGLPLPDELEGNSLLPLFSGERQKRPVAGFSSFWSEPDSRNLSWSVRMNNWKLYTKGPARTYLYDIVNDPREKKDVDDDKPLALRAGRIYLGQFIGAPDKKRWNRISAAAKIPKKKKEEEAEIPSDLREQLRALGYIN